MNQPTSPRTEAGQTIVALSSPTHHLLRDASLFLDFDGTLTEIALLPGAVVIDGRLRQLLSELARKLPGRLGIISGRPIGQLQQLLDLTSVALGGSHGVELMWPDGRTFQPPPPLGLDVAAKRMRRLQKIHSGIVIERKPFGVALHYRTEPTAKEACLDLVNELAGSTGLVLQAGKMVYELRIAGADKGSALKALMESPAMAGTLPIFIGDDDTDEAAFIAAAELGGTGILVGPSRPTAALWRLDDVAATLDWLEAASEHLS